MQTPAGLTAGIADLARAGIPACGRSALGALQEDGEQGHATAAAVLPVVDPRQPLPGGEQAMGHPCTWGQGLHLGPAPQGEADGHCSGSAPPDRRMRAGEVLPVVAALRATGPRHHCHAAQSPAARCTPAMQGCVLDHSAPLQGCGKGWAAYGW